MLVYNSLVAFAADSWVILASYLRRASAAAAEAVGVERSRFAPRPTPTAYAAINCV
jgi:hypothetical protein